MLAQFCHVTYRVDSAPTTNPGTTSYLLQFTADRDECIMSIKCTVRRSMIGTIPDALMLSSVWKHTADISSRRTGHVRSKHRKNIGSMSCLGKQSNTYISTPMFLPRTTATLFQSSLLSAFVDLLSTIWATCSIIVLDRISSGYNMDSRCILRNQTGRRAHSLGHHP